MDGETYVVADQFQYQIIFGLAHPHQQQATLDGGEGQIISRAEPYHLLFEAGAGKTSGVIMLNSCTFWRTTAMSEP